MTSPEITIIFVKEKLIKINFLKNMIRKINDENLYNFHLRRAGYRKCTTLFTCDSHYAPRLSVHP